MTKREEMGREEKIARRGEKTARGGKAQLLKEKREPEGISTELYEGAVRELGRMRETEGKRWDGQSTCQELLECLYQEQRTCWTRGGESGD